MRLVLFLMAFSAALVMTNQAYHIRNAYQSLPKLDMVVVIGLIWALFGTIPSLIALQMEQQNLPRALAAGGLLTLLALVVFMPINFSLLILLSLE